VNATFHEVISKSSSYYLLDTDDSWDVKRLEKRGDGEEVTCQIVVAMVPVICSHSGLELLKMRQGGSRW
jgi:hypothetical protein